MTPLLSVIIPIYNTEKYLHRCLDSISNQSMSNFEVILIDDGSTDDSGAICDEYAKKDNRFTVIHKTNGGVSSARNLGLQHASGFWICFVDSDDYLQSDYLQKLFGGNSDTCQLVLLNDSESVNPDSYSEQNMVDCFLENEILARTEPFCKLFNSKIIVDNSIRFNEGIHMGEDALFFFEYVNAINTFEVRRGASSYIYNKHEGSLSSKYYTFESEYSCFLKWHDLLKCIICKYTSYNETIEKLLWEKRTAATFLRTIQCLRRHNPSYSYDASVKYLNSIPKCYTDSFGKYYKPTLLRRKMNVFLIKHRLFSLYWLYSLLDRK